MAKRMAVAGGCVAVVLVLGLWLSPFVAAFQIRERAAARDASLEELVDFPALRQSVATQYERFVREEAQKSPQDPLSDVALVFASFAVDALVENVASPGAFAYLASLDVDRFSFGYENFNTFRIETPNLDGEPVRYELHRQSGFSWRVTNVVLPLS